MSNIELMGGKLQLYRRGKSSFWWCAASVGGKQRRSTTKKESLQQAQAIAEDWYLTLQGKDRAGIVVLNETQKSSVLNAVDNHGKSLPFKFMKPLQIGFDCDLPKTEGVAIHPLALAGRKATASCAALRNAICLFCGIERLETKSVFQSPIEPANFEGWLLEGKIFDVPVSAARTPAQ